MRHRCRQTPVLLTALALAWLAPAEARAQAPAELLVRGGLVVTAAGRLEGDVRIRGEAIVEIGAGLRPNESPATVIDASGLVVLPGGIDPHVHLTGNWVDDFTTGSHAALAGGITTVGNMSTPLPDESLLETLDRVGAIAEQQAVVDVMLHPVVRAATAQVIEEIPRLAEAGHTSIKIFMVGRAFDANAADYLGVLRAAGAAGILTMMHCEDGAIIADAVAQLMAAGRGSLRNYAQSRPVVAEAVATGRAAGMSEATGAPVYAVHLSSMRALRLAAAARTRGVPFFVETRPMYLHLTSERYRQRDGALFAGQPPLREQVDVDALWDGLARGTIQVVATDHAPWTRDQKLDPGQTVERFRAGVNNLQVMLPMLYSQGVKTGRITLERFVEVSATNAARLFGLYPRKGTIAVGSDADLALWNPDEVRTIRDDEALSRAGFSIYSGTEVTGWPTIVIRRGEVVYRDGAVLGAPGSGRLAVRGLSQPVP